MWNLSQENATDFFLKKSQAKEFGAHSMYNFMPPSSLKMLC